MRYTLVMFVRKLRLLVVIAGIFLLAFVAQSAHAQQGTAGLNDMGLAPDQEVVPSPQIQSAPAPVVLARPADTPVSCAGAGGGFVPLECFQGSVLQGVYTESNFGSFVQKMFVGAISFGAIFAVFRLAWAGFLYMGDDVWSNKEHAREIIRETFLGLFLLLGIWLILYQINPNLLKLDLSRSITPVRVSPVNSINDGTAAPQMQQFTAPVGDQSFFSGAGNQYDATINGCGVNGCDTFNATPISP